MENIDDEEQLKRALKLGKAMSELHKLMRRVVKSAKTGRQKREPDDDIDLDIGDGTLLSCGRYGQVRFFPKDSKKYGYSELQIDGCEEIVSKLASEIKSRFEEFQEKKKKYPLEYMKGKKKFAMEIFGRSLRHIIE